MVSKKEIQMVSVLLEAQSTFITSQNIAKAVGCSDRTVRKYLKSLETELESKGAKLISKQGFGYQLSIENRLVFDCFWLKQQSNQRLVSDVTKLEVADDRERYIINKLFFEGSQCSISSLSEELFISKTSVSQMVSDIRQLVSNYHISLVNQSSTLQIRGREEDIRHFIKDYFFLDSFNGSVFSLIGDELLEKVHLSEIIHIVINRSRNAGLKLADYVLHNLILHLALAIKRLKKGHQIQSLDYVDDLLETSEYPVAQAMIDDLESTLGIEFPPEEVAYVTIHLRVGNHQLKMADQSESQESLLEKHLYDAITSISQSIGLPLDEDSHLINNLKAHFTPLLSRLSHQVQLFNPLTEDIQKEYGEVLELVKTAFSLMPELLPYSLTDDEWVYIALHILATIEKMSQQEKKRALVVCATGIGSARMLKNRLEKEFSHELEIADVISYFDLAQYDLEKVDIIISSVDLNAMVFLVPVVQVGVLLHQQDIIKVQKALRQVVSSGYKHTKSQTEEKNALEAMHLFQEHQFLVFDDSVDKNEALKKLISRLAEGDQEEFVSEFQQQLELRESLSPVVFGEVLAFPHPARAMTLTEQVVVGIVKDGIVWNKTYPNVRFIFLLSPSMTHNSLLKLLSPCLVDFVEQPDLQNRLLEQTNFEEFKQIFSSLLGGK